jgi:hypothetical protein
MSPGGWPKGKPRGPYSEERIRKLRVGGQRHRIERNRRLASLAAGRQIGGTKGSQFGVQGGVIDISPAAFRSVYDDVADCEYVDDGLDDCLLRALDGGVVYAGTPYMHRETAFQDITIDVLAAVERDARKNGRRRRMRLPGTPLKEVKTKKLVARPSPTPLIRAGTPLTAVVAEMFSARAGKPLLEVVSEMFDS